MIIDILLIIILLFGFVIGFKRGFTKQLVSFLGILIVLILSFILKNPISVFMYKYFPFFSFNGISSLNILFYEVLSFSLIFGILTVILRILIMITGIFEKVLKFTIILGIPSKILGGILGIIENYIIIFVVLFFISMPIFDINLSDSKISNYMLNNTPILSNICENTIDTFNDFSKLKKEYKGIESIPKLNKEALDLFIKYKIISKENVEQLIRSKKITNVEV